MNEDPRHDQFDKANSGRGLRLPFKLPERLLRALRRRPIAAVAAFAGVLAVVALVLVLIMVFTRGGGGHLPQHLAKQQFTLTPLKADAIGIDPGTTFELTSDQSIDADLLRSLLRIDPPMQLDVKRENGASYRIIPKEPLDTGKVYHFSLAVMHNPTQVLASWAFQTKSPIQIVQTLPRDQASQVPVNTGIELTFDYEGVQDIASHFRIDPPADGQFEVHKRVIVFVPKALAKGTLYTVTVSAGLGVQGSTDTLAKDFVFQFETNDAERTGNAPFQPIFSFTRRLAEASTSEAPALELYSSQNGAINVPVEVFRYQDMDAFRAALEVFQKLPSWADLARDSFQADTQGLTQVATFQADAQQIGTYGARFLQFPAPLPAGFYLVQGHFNDKPVQTWLEVTDVATYITVSSGKTLIWVNDLAAKAPIANAQIEFLGLNAKATTDGQGIAFADTPADLVQTKNTQYGYVQSDTTGNLLVTAPDGRSAIVPLSNTASGTNYGGYYGGFFGRGFSLSGDAYWHYLSTDRPLYKPTDTARFWGVARRRENPVASETLTIELTGADYLDYNYQPVRIAETTVQTSSRGTFNGTISFAGLSPGYYQLTVVAGDQRIETIGLQVQTYTKPAYKIDVVPSKQAVFSGDSIDFAVTASFFDGSPVPGLKLNYHGDDTGQVTTDAEGRAGVAITAGDKGVDYVGSSYLSFTPALAEEGEIIGEASVSVHPADLTLVDTSTRIDGGQGVIAGTVRHVDLSRINAGSTQGYDDYLGDPAAGTQVSLLVTEVSYQQQETGQYYDFIAKIVRKSYRYDRIEAPLGDFSATTDGQGNFSYRLPIDQRKDYQINVTVTDSQGRHFTTHAYLSGDQSAYNGQSNYVYLEPPGGSASYYGGAGQLAIGDQAELRMQRGSDALPGGGDNRYLFYQAQNGVRKYAVQDSSTFKFAFGADDAPSTTVLGVWFNGRTYLEVNYGYQLSFDPAARKLDIKIKPDKDRYRPGEKATLDVAVTDAAGKPKADAEVNLAVVDEALFRILGSNQFVPDVLARLYLPVGPGIVRTYASHQYPTDAQPAERGGDGGARGDFADVAFYGSVTTDSAGHASVSFDLPDNLTSWRLTGQGFSGDLEAGTAIAQVPVGLPFFVDVTMNDQYLVTDKPEIKVRSFGTGLSAGEEVTFELSAPSLGLTQPAHVTAQAFQAASIPLPALQEGEQEVTISASAGDLKDAVVRKISVVPSRLVKGEARFYELQNGLTIEGSADRPTKLVFSDHERGRYLPILSQLTWEYGDRVDQMLARDVAAQLLHDYFNDVDVAGQKFDASLYQTPEGGIALFPYSGSDLTLSARIAALSPDRFGRTALSSYLLKVVEKPDETRERQIIALYGLAALHEPVLVPLQSLAKTQDLTWRERVYLGLAALELGDDATARAIYRGLISDFGESRPPYERLRVGTSQDEILEATSLMAILAGGLGEELAPALFDYTTNNYTKDILVELEQISYLAKTLPRLSASPVRFAYTLNGARKEVTLGEGESLVLQVSPEELHSLQLKTIEGSVGVGASFTAPAQASDFPHDSDISITRTIGDQNGQPVILNEGDLVRITLGVQFGPQALDGCYQVSDLLPSGLKPVTRPYAWGLPPTVTYPYRIDGQRVSFCVTKAFPNANYYARVVNTGAYTAEPVLVQSMKSAQSANLSPPIEVQIK